ncbi:hypothetical protein QM467_03320 [Rhodoblastus sp. 17X3]|uniref:hypothetical protein n=1 Tax=Rhodoblastus sp. 17X3 TaxID=3047026 RepID=UPI0024B82F0F|nr:hypothetical protein [Rhodoblastus sp. 17X3]MDI9847089.1 hypothetical protein [Rhodoblastus sp. 17X3]
MPTVDDEHYRTHMVGMVEEGFTLDPPGYERLSAWTHILMNLFTARSNFERVKNAPIKLGEMGNAVEQQAFFVAGIIAYCRCYASTGSAIPKLNPKQVYVGSGDGMEVHERLMTLRNTFAAHADRNDLVRVTLAVKEDKDHVIVRHLLTSALPVPEIPDFLGAVAHTTHYVTVGLNKQLDKMGEKIGKIITLD